MWPAIIGGAASILSSLIGGSRSYDNTASTYANILWQNAWRDQDWARQQEVLKSSIGWKMDDLMGAAKKHGIHPLAMLGQQGQSYTASNVGSPGVSPDFGRKQGGTRQAIAEVMRTAPDLIMKMISISQAKEKLKNMKLTNQGLQKEVEDLKRGHTVTIGKNPIEKEYGIVGQSNPELEVDAILRGANRGASLVSPEVSVSSQQGVKSGIMPMERYATDIDGYVRLFITQELSEPMESDWFAKGERIVDQARRKGNRIFFWRFPRHKGAKEHRDALRKIRPKAPTGYEYRLNPKRGWKLYKRYKGDRGSFYEKAANIRGIYYIPN